MTLSITDQMNQEMSMSQESEVILSVNNVSKRFCRDLKRSLVYGIQDITFELLGLRGEIKDLRPKEFWALDNVSFQLKRGEALGLVGKNGSGKSTLLRIIAGLIKPDTGNVEVKGRVAPLIALGAAFNPILTGRENIYANMAILGLSKQDIDKRFDEVVEFAEIGEAIDAPVQSYSSGMAARLGFATAIHTEPDVLLIDEVLAVGDSKFRGKCFQKLHQLRQNGTAFVLVSHDSHTILAVCETSVYLSKGICVGFGDTALLMSKYEEELFLDGGEKKKAEIYLPEKPKHESSGLDITSICFRDFQENVLESPTTGEPVILCIGCMVHEAVDNVGFTVVIKGLAEGGEIVLLLNCLQDKTPFKLAPGKNEIGLEMPYLGLKLGAYIMDVYVKKDGIYHLDSLEAFQFEVYSNQNISRNLFYQPRIWKMRNLLK
jgi:lipopolysaccharide transport system ATP-binding protein